MRGCWVLQRVCCGLLLLKLIVAGDCLGWRGLLALWALWVLLVLWVLWGG